MTFSQIGASEHAAEIHWVHVKEGTDDDLLVVGVLFDTTKYGENVEVSVPSPPLREKCVQDICTANYVGFMAPPTRPHKSNRSTLE